MQDCAPTSFVSSAYFCCHHVFYFSLLKLVIKINFRQYFLLFFCTETVPIIKITPNMAELAKSLISVVLRMGTGGVKIV